MARSYPADPGRRRPAEEQAAARSARTPAARAAPPPRSPRERALRIDLTVTSVGEHFGEPITSCSRTPPRGLRRAPHSDRPSLDPVAPPVRGREAMQPAELCQRLGWSSTRRSNTRWYARCLVAPSRRRGPPPACPRKSPPAASAASRAASSRSASDPARRGEHLGHRRPDLVGLQHVPLDAEPFSAGRWPACGMHSAPVFAAVRPVRVEERDLPHRREARPPRGARRAPRAAPSRPASARARRSVTPLRERLGCDGAHAGCRPGTRCAGVERSRLHRDPELGALRVPRDDRVRHALALTSWA